jgi:hypothetical protein
MELMFNELSINLPSKDKYDANLKVIEFVKTFSAARRNGFKRIRSEYHPFNINLSLDYSLRDWFFDSTVSKDYKDILFGTIITPFITIVRAKKA